MLTKDGNQVQADDVIGGMTVVEIVKSVRGRSGAYDPNAPSLAWTD